MALSNWDTLAISETGESIGGEITSASGVTVMLYKNWLYVRGSDGEIIMRITFGSIDYKDIHIEAVRGPQNGCYAIVTAGIHVMAGCGVYGYTQGDEAEWIGVSPECVDFLRKMLSDEVPDWLDTQEERNGNVHFKMATALGTATRFNQGDAYFNREVNAGIEPTAPGEADMPLMSKIIKGV